MEQPVVSLLRKSALVGVVPPHETVGLKRHSLMCRHIVIPAWEVSLGEIAALLGPQLAREVEWLRDLGVVVGIDPDDLRPTLAGHQMPAEVEADRATLGNRINEVRAYLNAPLEIPGESAAEPRSALLERIQPLIGLTEERNTSLARFIGSLLRVAGISAVPLIAEWKDVTNSANIETVVHVVIDNLPIPDEATAWEVVLEFRDDERVREHYAALQLWIARAANGTIAPHELAGEIEASVDRFKTYMHQYHIERSSGMLEAVVRAASAFALVAGVGASETVAVAAAVGSIPVTLKRRKAALMRQELTAPGSDLAYIVKARERFGK